MRIHILVYTNPDSPSQTVAHDLALLETAARLQGHTVHPIYASQCQMKFGGGKTPQVLVNFKKPRIEVLLVKASFLGTDLDQHNTLIKQFELSGIPVVNNHIGVIRAKNKLRTLQILSKHKIPQPKTYVVRSAEYVDEVMKDIGSYPVILKANSGSHGLGVSIVESNRGLRSVIELIMQSEGAGPLVIQEYVKESTGKDIRVFILGNTIIAAMERIATRRGEFRSNFKLGGRVRIAELSEKEKEVALAAARACGLDMAGVDVVRTKRGPKILEVNANPGLEGITLATGKDIAGAIIAYTVKKAKKRKDSNGG